MLAAIKKSAAQEKFDNQKRKINMKDRFNMKVHMGRYGGDPKRASYLFMSIERAKVHFLTDEQKNKSRRVPSDERPKCSKGRQLDIFTLIFSRFNGHFQGNVFLQGMLNFSLLEWDIFDFFRSILEMNTKSMPV